MTEPDIEAIRELVAGKTPEEVHEAAVELTSSAAQRLRRRRNNLLVERALSGR